MEILRRQLDYAGMKYSPKKEPCLISHILTPASFPHHNEIATTDRYRSILNRIQSSLFSDVEVWQSILSDCSPLYQSQILPALEAEIQRLTTMMMAHSRSVTKIILRNIAKKILENETSLHFSQTTIIQLIQTCFKNRGHHISNRVYHLKPYMNHVLVEDIKVTNTPTNKVCML